MCLNKFCRIAVTILLATASAIGQTNLRLEMSTQVDLSHSVLARSPSLFQYERAKKSTALAIAYSLFLPGLGDLYAENFGIGKYFMGADAGLWLTYGGVRMYGHWLKDDAKTLAIQGASANFDGKDEKFEVDLGNFADVLSYNDAKLRNREYELLYDPKSSFAWNWNSDADRVRYKDLRNRGESTLRNSQFVLGALVLNRIISAISAARAVSAYNRSVQDLGSWRMNARVSGGMLAADGIELTFTKEF